MSVKFFKKGSRKSKPEQNLFNEITRQMQGDPEFATRVEAYVKENGHATNLDELVLLKKNVGASSVGEGSAEPAKTESKSQGENIQQKPKAQPKEEPPVEKIKVDKTGKYSDFAEVVQDIKDREAAASGGFDPFKNPVIERDYAGQIGAGNTQTSSAEGGGDDIPADAGGGDVPDTNAAGGGGSDVPPTNTGGGGSDIPSGGGGGGGDIPSSNANEEELPEAGFNNTQGDGGVDTSDMGGEDITQKDDALGGDNLKDLSTAQKKKAAEKTAEVLLKGYKNYGTAHWKAMARMSKKKVDLLILQGRVNPNQVVQDGVTVKNYVKAWNDEVQNVFTPTEEALQAIREPLIEVLLEQGLALTPTQRLVWAIAENQIEMGAKAFQFLRTKKDTLAAFIKYNDGARAQQTQIQKEKIVKAAQEEEEVIVPTDDGDSTFEEIIDGLVEQEEDDQEAEFVEAEEVTEEDV